MAPLHYPNKNI